MFFAGYGQTAHQPNTAKDTRPLDNNDHSAHPDATPSEARGWTQILTRYRKPSDGRGTVEIGITLVPLVALWVLIWATLDVGYWLSLLLAVPAAGFLVRLFMIQHDCGHGAFFRHRLVNDWVGRAIGVRDADALRLLAPHPRAASRHVGKSRSPRLRRHRYADGARISRAVALRPAALSAVPASAGHVRHRPGLSVPAAAPSSGRADARRRLGALAQHHVHQSGDRHDRRRADLADRRQGVRAGASADHAARGLDRRVAVLRAAPVRGRRPGRTARAGTGTRPRCTAARTTSCRRSCAGSPPISACTTSIT